MPDRVRQGEAPAWHRNRPLLDLQGRRVQRRGHGPARQSRHASGHGHRLGAGRGLH